MKGFNFYFFIREFPLQPYRHVRYNAFGLNIETRISSLGLCPFMSPFLLKYQTHMNQKLM